MYGNVLLLLCVLLAVTDSLPFLEFSYRGVVTIGQNRSQDFTEEVQVDFPTGVPTYPGTSHTKVYVRELVLPVS